MGANLLVLASTLLLQPLQQDTSNNTEQPSNGFGRRVRPVLFLDAGQATRLPDLIASRALVGGGAGLSLLNGLIRFDFSRPISPGGARRLRFDLVIEGVR